MVMPGHTMVDMDTGEEKRGRLNQLQLLKLSLKQTPTTDTMAMVLDMEDMDTEATMVTAGHTMEDMDTGEERRGRLRLNQLLLLKLSLKQTLIMDTMAMVLDMEAMAMEDTMATDHTGEDMDSGEERREKLRLSQLLKLTQKPTLTMATTAMEDMVMVDITDLITTDLMAMDIGEGSNSYPMLLSKVLWLWIL